MRTSMLLLASALMACGARTALDDGVARDGGEGLLDAVEVGARGGPPDVALYDACGQEPWLVFGLSSPSSSHLYAIRADGTEGHALRLAPNGGSASLSADGTELFYVTVTMAPDDAGYTQALQAEDLRTGAIRALVSGPLGDAVPNYTVLSYSSLSPDGRTLAYTYGYDVRLVNIDGSNDRALLTTSADDIPVYGHPSFTPDSQTVLYGIDEAFGAIRADGSSERTLVTEGVDAPLFPNVTPSPDGLSVAAVVTCALADSGTSEATLRIYDLASLPAACSSGRVVTTLDPTSSSMSGGPNPSWGPTGLIAYGSGRDVYMVDPAGGAPRNMTAAITGKGRAAFDPIWAPACAPIP